ncbi:MAG: type VI secretion system ATPase TssH, partial [Proteobacteria bacterium]|nr:type VI secretion system ATPase TssH [Pseudomonadota bacterium]
MDPNKFTKKTQDAINQAQAEAIRNNHQTVDAEHLLFALASQDDGLAPKILKKIGVSGKDYATAIKAEIKKLPSVSGPGSRPNEVLITPRLNSVLVRADDARSRMQDEFVSVEHLFLALTDEPPSTGVGRVNRTFGVNRDSVYAALTQVRGKQRVTSDNPEASYEALTKYGRDLVDEARKGKLDPVIGRDDEIRRTIRILSRRTKNNPVLIGEAG